MQNAKNGRQWRLVMSDEKLQKLREFARDKQTPFLVLDIEQVRKKYLELKGAMPDAKIYYAVKACPALEVIKLLADEGVYFDVASIYEIDQVLSLGVDPARLSFGNTIKKEKDIAYAYKKGIRLYATDSLSDVRKLARSAPESRVMFRLLFDGEGADWPLSRKFGAYPDMLHQLVKEAKTLGLKPYGLAFHVGSQQRDIGQWDNAIALCHHLFDMLALDGIRLESINLGGGFPAHYIQPIASTKKYVTSIQQYLKENFGARTLDIILEPGRSLVGDAGVIFSEVILVSKKSETQDVRWVYLDIGKMNGLFETTDELIKYPICVENKENDTDLGEVIIAGPTCDSCDTLYEKFKYTLPHTLTDGDRVNIFSTGAYTASYSSVNFNGFPPLKVYIFDEQ